MVCLKGCTQNFKLQTKPRRLSGRASYSSLYMFAYLHESGAWKVCCYLAQFNGHASAMHGPQGRHRCVYPDRGHDLLAPLLK